MSKILVIEDEPQVLSNIEEILQMEGFEVLKARDGQIGLTLAQEKAPDLIVCDVMMPKLNGYQVLEQLRQTETTATLPLIFLTAKAEDYNLRRGMNLGADDYITKPFIPSELVQSVRSRLNHQSDHRQQLQRHIEQLVSNLVLALPQEFNTPLNDLMGLAQLLREDHKTLLPQEIEQMAGQIEAYSRDLHRLAHNFLIYSELELIVRNSQHLSQSISNSECCNIQAISSQVASFKACQFNRLGDLQVDLQDLWVKMPESRFRKLMEELIDNALKFSESGTPVNLLSASNGDLVYLYIGDQGRGMRPEQIKSIGAYMQFDRKQYHQRGVGLGLAIAQHLVTLSGGELVIDSIPDQQTIVRLALPQVA